MLHSAWLVSSQNICRIPSAKPGRESVEYEIFGMSGIPEGMEPGADPGDADDGEHSVLNTCHAACSVDLATLSQPAALLSIVRPLSCIWSCSTPNQP